MENQLIKLENLGSALDVERLNLFLFPTEKCNFRCTYCYEDHRIGKMSPALIGGIKKLLLVRFNDLKRLDISWFGGEPLLAKELIYDISDFILNNAPKSLDYAGNITTNGYNLNGRTFEKLIKYKITYFQISLDGDRLMHDQTRIRKDKNPTFDVIWNNLINMKSTDYEFSVLIRIHFTYDNYIHLDSLIQKINVEFGDDLRFKVFFKPIERLGGVNDKLIKTMNKEEKRVIKKLLDEKIWNKDQIFSVDEKKPYVCYASVPNSFIIRANGDVCKCTVALNNSKNLVGKINENGEILFNENFYLWLKGIETLNLETLACPLKSI